MDVTRCATDVETDMETCVEFAPPALNVTSCESTDNQWGCDGSERRGYVHSGLGHLEALTADNLGSESQSEMLTWTPFARQDLAWNAVCQWDSSEASTDQDLRHDETVYAG